MRLLATVFIAARGFAAIGGGPGGSGGPPSLLPGVSDAAAGVTNFGQVMAAKQPTQEARVACFVVTGVELKRPLLGPPELVGVLVNDCGKNVSVVVEVAFYDKEGNGIGSDALYNPAIAHGGKWRLSSMAANFLKHARAAQVVRITGHVNE